MAEKKRRLPSPRVMAAKILMDSLEGPFFRSAEDLSNLFDTKVSDAKREKYIREVEKLCRRFRDRMAAIVRRFEQPPPRKPKETKP